jgi:hypothetical protein
VHGVEKAYVDLDGPSGGYPYGVTDVLKAHDFGSIDAAKKYAGMFQTYPLKIKPEPITLHITVQA